MKTNKSLRNIAFLVLATISMLIASCTQAGDGMFTGRDKTVIALDNVTTLCKATGGHVGTDGNCYTK